MTYTGNGTAPGIAANSTLSPNTTIWGPLPIDNRRSLQADIIVCAIITWLIALFFVVIRFYARGRLIHVLGPSDWCIIPSLLFSAGVTASAIEQASRGEGKHAWQLDPAQLLPMQRAGWYGIFFYSLTLLFTKVSILLLYRQIFTTYWARRANRVLLWIVVIIGIGITVSVATACVPLQAFWDWQLSLTTKAYCHSLNVWWTNSALNIVTDLAIVLLPMPVLTKLKLPRRQKYALVGVFALGFFVCIVSILRVVELVRVETNPGVDASYSGAVITYWTTVEINAAIACACIMTLKPLAVHHFPGLLTPGSYLRRYTRNSRSPGPQRPSTMGSRKPSRLGLRYGSSWISLCRRRDLARLPSLEDEKAGTHAVKLVDIEAQRSDSISTAAQEEDKSPTTANLKAPPAAHLRLSIQVTKSVMVTSEKLRSPSSIASSKRRLASGDTTRHGAQAQGTEESASERSPAGSWNSQERIGFAE